MFCGLILIFIDDVTAQTLFKDDPDYIDNYAAHRQKLDVDFFGSNNIFELRVWIERSSSSLDLIRIIQTNDKAWRAEKYVAKKGKKNRFKKEQIKLDKQWFETWTVIENENIYTLPEQSEIKGKWQTPKEIINGDTIENVLIIATGVTYHFELLTSTAKRKYSYYCPFTNNDFYKREEELKSVVNILKILFKTVNYTEPSC